MEREIKPIVDFVRGASSTELEDYELKEWYPKGVRLPSNADRAYVEDLFGRAQLICLAPLRAAIMKVADPHIRDLLLFTFSGILARASITYFLDTKEAGGGNSSIFTKYRYWVPPHPDYRDVWELFGIRARLIASAKGKANTLFGDFVREGENFSVYHDSAENLSNYVVEKSVDYIYTDPPYGKHISYLDLSTMWHAWLGMEVTPQMRGREAIEDGEQQFDEKHYLDVLQKSFEEMFRVLKDDAWLSLVYHHKQTNLWYSIRDMLRYIGFTYANTVAQPLAKQTFHKIKNPLRVLGESLIVNFQKSAVRKMAHPMSLPMANVIKNAAELAIVRGGGATTEEILREVVPELFEANLIIDAASKNMGDILAMLEADFELGKDDLWHLKTGHKIGFFIPPRVRIQYYVVSYLRTVGRANFDSIVTTVLPLLINGHQPTKQDIGNVLAEVAVSYDGVNWELQDPKQLAQQGVLPLELPEGESGLIEVPSSTTHNQQIYRLAVLCSKAGLVPYIGKQERNDPMLMGLQPLTALNVKAEPTDIRRIEQIDIVWATRDAVPIWAFEVEEHTPVLSAFERFVALLSAAPEVGHGRRLTIVAPKARRRKLNQELTSSSYVGHPQYLENKLTYIYYEDLEAAFRKLARRPTIQLDELHSLCHLPPSPRTPL